jgi:HEPN domain-containing protein
MAEEIEFLRKRSVEFYHNACALLKEGKYNLSAFNLEQSCQLFLKFLIGKKVGEWPKTHYLNELVRELSKVYKEKEIINYYKKTSYSLRT